MSEINKQTLHESKRHIFGIIIIVLEVIITILYGLFLRVEPQNNPEENYAYYPMYQDVNAMILIGFGFLMTYIKLHAWSALVYTFFINAITVQLYILLSNFWEKVFLGEWVFTTIYIKEKSFTQASYSVAAILIAFGVVIGKVEPLEFLTMGLVSIIGYTLNQQLVYQVLKTFDVGRSMVIHVYGSFFGLSASFVLSRIAKPEKGTETTYGNIIFSIIGTLFLWMFWPFSNAAYAPANQFQRSMIITNTIVALTGSCLATFAFTSIMRRKFNMEDILNATLAGGVTIGASCGIVTNPGVSLAIGLIAGFVSTIGYIKLNHAIEKSWFGIHDTCGVVNLHGIPGLLGGFISAMVVASYQTPPGLDSAYSPYVDFQQYGRTYSQQAGIQVASTFMSMAMGILFGLAAGLILKTFYQIQNKDFFMDSVYFELPQDHEALNCSTQKKLGISLSSQTKIIEAYKN